MPFLRPTLPLAGVDEIYDGTFTRTLVPGDGVAVRLFKEAGIRVATEDTFKKVFRRRNGEGRTLSYILNLVFR